MGAVYHCIFLVALVVFSLLCLREREVFSFEDPSNDAHYSSNSIYFSEWPQDWNGESIKEINVGSTETTLIIKRVGSKEIFFFSLTKSPLIYLKIAQNFTRVAYGFTSRKKVTSYLFTYFRRVKQFLAPYLKQSGCSNTLNLSYNISCSHSFKIYIAKMLR